MTQSFGHLLVYNVQLCFGISGVAIGSGWQAIVAYVNLATYYIIGLPIGCVLGFKTSLGVAVSLFTAHFSPSLLSIFPANGILNVHFDTVQGIWWGMIIGVLLQTATLIILTARTNWSQEVII